MKILNLYAGIGGNRKLWDYPGMEVTAVEYDEKIARIYKDNFPEDNVVVEDAHEYLLKNFREFDFIWASPPCPSHSKVRKQLSMKKRKDGTVFEQNPPIYPDMRLYQEIILLDKWYDGFYCIENVVPYYEPLIDGQKLGRHVFWSNMELPDVKVKPRGNFDSIEGLSEFLGFDLSQYSGINKKLLLRNCVEPEVGKIIFDTFVKNYTEGNA